MRSRTRLTNQLCAGGFSCRRIPAVLWSAQTACGLCHWGMLFSCPYFKRFRWSGPLVGAGMPKTSFRKNSDSPLCHKNFWL